MNVAMVLAGGNGTRIGGNIPKQFIRVEGKSILAYTLEIFEANQNIDAIEIVCHREWMDEAERICLESGINKKRWLCGGGNTFQESVINGIFHVKGTLSPEDILVISYGVAPMTPQCDIDNCIRICKEHGNAIAVTDIDLPTCIKNDEYSSSQYIFRERLKAFSNPWTFKFGEICEVYEMAIKKGMLESIEPHTTSLYFALGKRIWFSKSTAILHKITHKGDLDLFKGYLLLEQERKTGKNRTYS